MALNVFASLMLRYSAATFEFMRAGTKPPGGFVISPEILQRAVTAATDDARVLQVNDALEKFALEEPEKAELVKLRYFVGLTLNEAAQALDIAEPTARRWWAYARAWLLKEMRANRICPVPIRVPEYLEPICVRRNFLSLSPLFFSTHPCFTLRSSRLSP